MTAELRRAIEIFLELGWQDAPLEELVSLPLGTAGQQKEALAGLRKGAWGSFGEIGDDTFGWQSTIPVDSARLGAFAVRLGVNARRAIDVLPGPHSMPDRVQAALLAQRGAAFAEEFIRLACVSRRRAWVNATSVYGGAAVRLVHLLDLEIPATVEYLKDWSAFAAAALGRPAEIFPDRELIDAETIRARFVEHARIAVEAAQPATASFGEAFPAGFAAGWMSRDIALELAFIGLETAQRPGDRAVWTRVLTDALGVTDDELLARASALVPTLAAGDAVVVEVLAPRLIAASGDVVLVELAAGSLTVRGKKSQLVVLSALAGRPAPRAEGVEEIVEQLRVLARGKDAAVAKAAQKVLNAWGSAAAPGDVPAAEPAARGVWRATPDVWMPPRREPLPDSPEALAAAAGVLMAKPEDVHDIDAETFLDLLVRTARADLDGARTALRGVKRSWTGGLRFVPGFVAGDVTDTHAEMRRILVAREYELLRLAGRIPSVLSTPTWVDMRVDPADLQARLADYADAGAPAAASDLVLALTRLDRSLVTAEQRAAFAAAAVPVVDHEGRVLPRSAGATVAAYLDDPILEPPLERRAADGAWKAEEVVVPASLADFPDRLSRDSWYSWHDGVIFPTWSDAVGEGFESYPLVGRGVSLRQGARHAAPYAPSVAVRFVGALRQLHPKAAEDAFTAVIEAFERGVLRPEAMDVRYLDPSDLAAMATVCLELADEGLTSLVWPLLDGLIVASLENPRMLSGTADLADAIAELLPTVREAVDAGLAPAEALALPGLRALATRSGSSRAVTAAKAAVAELPAAEPQIVSVPMRPDPRFDEIWPEGAGGLPCIVDDARLSAEWADPEASTKFLAIDLRLPDHPGEGFRVVKGGWNYDLENEGQCAAVRFRDGEDPNIRDPREGQVSLSWNGERLVVHPRRMGERVGPLTSSMHAAVLAALCHDGEYGLAGIRLARILTASGLIGWRGTQHAVRELLAWPDASPARMMRAMEKEPRTRAVLWPVITESIAAAAAAESLPSWLNRVLDMADVVLPDLEEAAARGWIPAEAAALQGVVDIAGRSGSQAAIRKAKALAARQGA